MNKKNIIKIGNALSGGAREIAVPEKLAVRKTAGKSDQGKSGGGNDGKNKS